MAELYMNKKASGSSIYNTSAPVDTQIVDIATHITKNLAPGAVSNITRMIDASNNVVTSYGKKYTMEDELYALMGIRTSTFDPNTVLFFNSSDFNRTKSEAHRITYEVLRDPNKRSEEEIKDAYQTTLEIREKAYTRMSSIIEAARSGGLTTPEIRTILTNSGMSKEDTKHLLAGTVPDWKPSKTSQRNAVKKANVLFDENTVESINARYGLF
jgi:hypothetical protein